MPEKNVRLQEWFEKFRWIIDESIAEQRAIKVKARRVREEKDEIKWYHFPT